MNISELTHGQKAYTLAKISKLVYDNDPKFSGFESTKISVDSNVAFVLYNKTDIIVACRGTELSDGKDLLTDAKAILVKSVTETGKGHLGFETAAKSVWDHILLVIDKVNTGQHIWFTGHSLGAAMSLILAALYKKNNPNENIIMFSFGCPRVGNSDNTRLSSFTHHRYVDSADIVPRIPLWPFYHHGTLHYINSDGKEIKPGSLTLIKDRVKCFFNDPTNIIQKHFIDQYLEVLNNIEADK